MIGRTKNEVNQCAVDFYSIGHVLFGYLTFFLSYFILSHIGIIETRLYSIIAVLLVALLWELVENIMLSNTRFKFNCSKDSVENSLFDIVFCFIGGVLGEIFSFLPTYYYFSVSFVFTVIMIILLEGCFKLTINERK